VTLLPDVLDMRQGPSTKRSSHIFNPFPPPANVRFLVTRVQNTSVYIYRTQNLIKWQLLSSLGYACLADALFAILYISVALMFVNYRYSPFQSQSTIDTITQRKVT
jgi:hypothetical protein